MSNTDSPTRALAKTRILGAGAGLAAVVVYAITANAQNLGLTGAGAHALAAFFGPCLLIACYAFRRRLNAVAPTEAANLGFVFIALASAMLTAMVFTQFAVRDAFPTATDRSVDMETMIHIANRVQLALDLTWDVFLCFGSFFFALAMLHMSRLASGLAVLGMGTAVALLALNLAAFPALPTEAGWPDVGPFLAGWYLMVALLFSRATRDRPGA